MAVTLTFDPSFHIQHRKYVAYTDAHPSIPYVGYTVEQHSFDNRAVSGRRTVDPVTESRPKPAEPLYNHLTAHGPGVRFRSTSGVAVEPMRFMYRSYPWDVYHEDYSNRVVVEPTGIPESRRDGAMQHLLKLRGFTNDVSGLFAELHRSADGFAAAARTVGNIVNRIRGVRRGRFRLADVASTNLAVNFGIKPVVSDVWTAYEATKHFNTSSVHRVYTRTPERIRYMDADNVTWDGSRETRRTSYIRLKSAAFGGADGNVNIGNPVEWAWELIPFSFVIDWMIPVGDYIAASFADRGLQLLGTSRTTKVNLKLYDATLPIGNFSTWVEKPEASYESYVRAIDYDFESPEMVRFQPTNSFKALGNALSLLVAIRGGNRVSSITGF